jgi:hypothetical protein
MRGQASVTTLDLLAGHSQKKIPPISANVGIELPGDATSWAYLCPNQTDLYSNLESHLDAFRTIVGGPDLNS